MNRLLGNDGLSNKIKDLFTELENDLIIEQETLFDNSRKWAISETYADFSMTNTREGIKNLQLAQGIKIKTNNLILWNPEYKNEALSSTYLKVLNQVSRIIRNVRREILQELKKSQSSDISILNKYLPDKTNHFYKLIDSEEGAAYCYEDERQAISNLHKSKYDVIWHINEQYSIFPLEKRNTHKSNYPKDLDYPFVDINIIQWIEFESASRLIPLFEKLPSILENKSSRKEPSLTPLEQIAFIERLRFKNIDFRTLDIETKMKYLNLITGGNNFDKDKQIENLEFVVTMSQRDYENLQENASNFGREMYKIQNKSEPNFRKALKDYNTTIIQEGKNRKLNESEETRNEKARTQISKNKKIDVKVAELLKTIE